MFHRLVQEAHRRRVLRVAGLYVVGAWTLVQFADVVLPGFGMPGGAIRALLWTALAGMPLALIFGWMYDVGPTGIQRTPPSGPDPEPVPLSGFDLLVFAVLGMVLAAILYGSLSRFMSEPELESTLPAPAPGGQPQISLAVLPFTSLGDDPEDGFLAVGVSAEVLSLLAEFEDLRVMARTSSFPLAAAGVDLPEMVRLLGVRYLLQGSVQRADDTLAITVALLDDTGSQVWGRSYEVEFGNLFAGQGDIVSDVVSRLVPGLTFAVHSHVVAPDPEAYRLFMVAREMLRSKPAEYRGVAIEGLNKALDLAPGFAMAHAELAIVLILGEPWTPPTELETLRAAAAMHIDRALALDSSLARGYAARGLFLDTRDPATAEWALRRAVELDPQDTDARNWLHRMLMIRGYPHEALEYLRVATRSDPLATIPNVNLAGLLARRGEWQTAEEHLLRLWRLPGRSETLGWALADHYRLQGRLVESTAIEKERLRLGLEQTGRLAATPLVSNYAMIGDWEMSEAWLARMLHHPQPAWLAGSARFALQRRQGRFEEAAEEFRLLYPERRFPRGSIPGEIGAIHLYGMAMTLAGDFPAAVQVLRERVIASPAGSPDSAHALAWAYEQLAEGSSAADLLEAMESLYSNAAETGWLHTSRDRFFYAQTVLLRGNTERALDLLESAVNAGWRDPWLIRFDPRWARLQGDPRFESILERVQSDVDRQRVELRTIDALERLGEDIDQQLARSATVRKGTAGG